MQNSSYPAVEMLGTLLVHQFFGESAAHCALTVMQFVGGLFR